MSQDDAPSGQILSPSDATRGGLLNAGASVVGTVLTYALTLVVTNSYGSAATGVFFSAIAVFMITATATKLGAETALVLFVARLRAEGRLDSAGTLLRVALLPVLLASVLAGLGLWFGAESGSRLFDQPENEVAFARVLRGLAPFVPAWSISLCLLGATRGVGTMRPTALGLQVVQPVAQFALVLIAVGRDQDLDRIAVSWAIPTLLTAGIAVWTLSAALRHVRTDGGHGASRAFAAADFWRYAGARGIAGSLQMTLDRIGVVLVAALASAALAGQWSAIARLVGVAQRFFHAIGQGLNPRISGLAHRNRWSEVSRAVITSTDWTIVVVGPILIALAIFPRAALALFGEDFTDGSTGLIVAAAAIGAAVVFAHADNVLLMAGAAGTAMGNTALALVASVVLHIVLVPPLEVVGAALAMAGGVAVYRLSAAVQIQRRYGVTVFDGNTLRIIAAALALVAGPALVLRIIAGDRLVIALIAAALTAAIYGLGVSAARATGRIDLGAIRS